MEAARFLRIRGETVRFRKSQNKFGQDFDLEWLVDDYVICCEVETKLEEQKLDETNVWRTLEHARRQVPKDGRGVIILRVLGHSTREDLDITGAIVTAAVRRLFRQSRRLMAVVLLTRVYQFQDDTLSMWPAWKVMINPKSNHSTGPVENIRGSHSRLPSDWTELVRYKPRFVFD